MAYLEGIRLAWAAQTRVERNNQLRITSVGPEIYAPVSVFEGSFRCLLKSSMLYKYMYLVLCTTIALGVCGCDERGGSTRVIKRRLRVF
jgi:hypothetical protein